MEPSKSLNVAIVGGGPGCKAIMDIIIAEKLSQLNMKLIGVASTNPKAIGYLEARKRGVFTTTDYRDLYEIDNLDMIIELTGRDEVANEIARTKPDHVRVMDHVAARLFWDVFRIEEESLEERRRTEETLRESEEKFRLTFENTVDAIFWTNLRTGVITNCNKAAETLLERGRDEMIGQHQTMLHPPQRAEYYAHMFKRHIEHRGSVDEEAEVITKSGKIIPVRIITSITLVEGEPIIQGLFHDITERRRAREALQASEEKYATLVENSLTGIYIDQDGRIVFANKRFADIYGYSRNELIGMQTWRLVHPEDRGLTDKIREKRLKGAEAPSEYEARGLTKDGEKIWILRRNTRIEYKGRPAILGNIVNVTERRQAKQALLESEDKYRHLFHNAQVGLFRTRISDGKLLECNERLAEMFAYPSREACLAEFVSSEHYLDAGTRERMLATVQKKDEIHNFEARLSRRDGSVIWIRYSARLYPDEGYLEGVVTDITEEKEAVEALVRAKEDWENTFDAITDMVMLLDKEHRIVRINRSATDAFNAKKKRLVGKKCYEAVHGQSKPITDCPLIITTQTGKPSSREVTLPGMGRTCICSTSPIFGHERDLTGYTHILRDITESKSLEAQLMQAKKLEAIGTLAGGIAHDFNNLLMGIQGNVSLMLMGMDPAYPDYGRLKTVEKQIQSGSRLTSQLLGYARKGKYEVKPLNLNWLVEGTSDTFGRTRREITIRRELAQDLWAVEADRAQMEQVLLNLFVNAADAMPGGGTLTLKTANLVRKDMRDKPYDLKPGNYVLLTVTDSGTGMYKKTLERIFDPFFTTKEMGRGTGLGLASAYGIIKAHGGHIDVDSQRGRGTSFSIYLPASQKQIREVVRSADTASKGTGTVLLVDDEEVVLEVGQDLLEAIGYRVLTARDGQEAVKVYQENHKRIDIVVLDMIMPNMGGGEAFDRMRDVNPGAKVLLSSGFSIDGQAGDILKRGCDGFIQKPFTVKQLSGKIREILDRKEA